MSGALLAAGLAAVAAAWAAPSGRVALAAWGLTAAGAWIGGRLDERTLRGGPKGPVLLGLVGHAARALALAVAAVMLDRLPGWAGTIPPVLASYFVWLAYEIVRLQRRKV